MDLKKKFEERAKAVADSRAILDKAKKENRGLNAEEREEIRKFDVAIDGFSADIEIEQKQQEREAMLAKVEEPTAGRPSPSPTAGAPAQDAQRAMTAFRKWLRWGNEALDSEERSLLRPAAATEGRKRGSDVEIRLRPTVDAPEFRGQTVGTGSAGGFTVPEGFSTEWEISMKAFGGMRQASRIVPTASGNDLPWPTANDTGNVGELLAEEASIGSHVGVTVGQIILKAYKYSSKLVQVSTELLEDSAFNIAGELGRMLGERIARITNTHFTTGDNSSKPQGAVTGSSLGKTAASATAVTVDELIDLEHSVDPAYRVGPNVRFMFNDSTLAAIRKLTKADWAGGIPVWQPGLASGVPSTILGHQYIINQDMASIATGNKSVLFGDFSKYLIRDVAGFRLRRLEELYAATDQVGFIAFTRHDGRVLDAGTDPIKHLIQA